MQEQLIKQGIKLNIESQEDFNKGLYENAIKKRISSNKILEGFNDELINKCFKLFL